MRKRQRKFTKEFDKEIIDAYLGGLNFSQIVNRYKINRASAYYLIVKVYGIKTRPRGNSLGNPSGMLGKHHSEEAKEKMRNVNLGEKHWNWKGGSSSIKYPHSWTEQLKDKVRVRDNFKCRMCEVPELELTRKLDIHHIDYDKYNICLDNLIALCHPCHTKTNSKHDYWKQYLTKGVIC